jgi:pilus assembly protein Flp/PilA
MAHAMMVRLHNWLANLREREEGQGLVEYVVLIGLIALAVFAAVTFFEDEISTTFSEIANEVRGTLPGG